MGNVSTQDWDHYTQRRKRELRREHRQIFKPRLA